jgi:hypothetical protein
MELISKTDDYLASLAAKMSRTSKKGAQATKSQLNHYTKLNYYVEKALRPPIVLSYSLYLNTIGM